MALQGTLFSDFLEVLDVKHTLSFSNTQFENMNFKSLFGLSRLLSSYDIPNAAFRIEDKKEILSIPPPFIAQRNHSFVIVTDVDSSGDTVSWKSPRGLEKDSTAAFLKSCSGIVMQAYPDDKSIEPDYKRHHLLEIAEKAKRWILTICFVLLVVWGFISSHLYADLSTTLLTVVDLAGLGVAWLLILKSLKVKSAAADNVCGVLQRHGCDHVLEDKASSFFGLFSWSEVGLAYFSVSLAVLLIFPGMIGTLALINACCLPFTVWSIWYQKFRIKTWCTLCVITQSLLWCQFFCYLFGGWWSMALPINIGIIPLIGGYVGVMLAANAICGFIKKRM